MFEYTILFLDIIFFVKILITKSSIRTDEGDIK